MLSLITVSHDTGVVRVCCYLHGLPPDQLFKPGVVIRSEGLRSQFPAGRGEMIWIHFRSLLGAVFSLTAR